MEYYLVSAIPRLTRMNDLETRLATDEFLQLQPFGPALSGSLRNARLSARGLAIWEEENDHNPPLANERTAVLDRYFDQLLTSQVRQGEGWNRVRPLRPLFPTLARREDPKMRLKVSVREVGGVTVVDLNGKLVFGEETANLRETVARMVQEGKKNILLNLADVSFIDSMGVGQLVSCYLSAENRGARLRLVNTQKEIPDVLRITRVDTVIPGYANEEIAVASFSQ